MNAAARSRPARRRGLLLVLVLMVAPLLAACEDADSEMFLELAADWAVEKNLLTFNCRDAAQTDCEYALNTVQLGVYIAVGRGLALADQFIGNEAPAAELGAALDAAEVIKAQEEADRLAAAGTAQGDLSLIDQAIEQRPNDWSYHEQRAALLLAQGDDGAAQAAFATSETLVQERIRAGASCQPLMLNMLRHRENALTANAAAVTVSGSGPLADVADKLDAVQNDIADLESGEPSPYCP